jgi:hypothetical protein
VHVPWARGACAAPGASPAPPRRCQARGRAGALTARGPRGQVVELDRRQLEIQGLLDPRRAASLRAGGAASARGGAAHGADGGGEEERLRRRVDEVACLARGHAPFASS